MNQFYLTLPSDSSSKFYPKNTTACFKTKLSERIELDGEYEVGLAQLIYPHSWFNFNNKKNQFSVSYLPDDGGAEIVTTLRSGNFPDERTLAIVLIDWISITGILFKWDPWERKMELVITNKVEGKFSMSEDLAAYLGFDNPGPYGSGSYLADHAFDLRGNVRMFYVYSDIVSYSPVGEKRVPLLRVCETQGVFGKMISTTFTHPHYVPLARSSFETIEININNELGKPMPFEFGKTVVTLHFRKKNRLLL